MRIAPVNAAHPRIAIALGDPRGIGPEITRKVLTGSVPAEVTLVGPDDLIADLPAAERIGVGSWKAVREGRGEDSRTLALRAGTLAGRAIETAAGLALEGSVDAIVTAPIEKHATRLAGFPYPGHTEWLAHLAGDVPVAMMLAADRLRVVLITTHVAFRDVPALLTIPRIVETGRTTLRGLQDWFGIASPRIALCALNPHAGEQGLFGDEEARVMVPAAEALGVSGPFPADTVFVRAMQGEFDAVLVPSHDVGMTAIKVAAFGKGVNVTLGLPFPRTSPDHGTALDIAGKGIADPSFHEEGGCSMAIELGRKEERG